MILATLKGRLQTKIVTYIILGSVTTLFAAIYGSIYFLVCGIAIIVGLLLETLWGIYVTYQSGWMTILFGGIEFFIILSVAYIFAMPMTFTEALQFYLTAWTITQLFLIYIMPVLRISWTDDGLELW